MSLALIRRTILFYLPSGEYGFFSNFSLHAITVDGKLWPTSEHYYQAMKSPTPEIQEMIRKLRTPGKSKQMGNSIIMRSDWDRPSNPDQGSRDEWGLAVENVKDHVMMVALRAKFTQHERLKQALLATGDAIIVENTQSVGSDPYWGNGPSGTGLNKLGRQLMYVRAQLAA